MMTPERKVYFTNEQLDELSKEYRTLPTDAEGYTREPGYNGMSVRNDISKLIADLKTARAALEEAQKDAEEWKNISRTVHKKHNEVMEVNQTLRNKLFELEQHDLVKEDLVKEMLFEAQQTIARQQAKIDAALSWTWNCGEANMLEVISALKGGEGATEEWEVKIKPGDKVIVNVGHLQGQELPVSANHSHKRLVSVIASDGLWNVAYGDFEKAGEGAKEGEKTEPHSCGEGGECRCIDCGGTESQTWVCGECQKRREAKGCL